MEKRLGVVMVFDGEHLHAKPVKKAAEEIAAKRESDKKATD